MYSTVSIIRIGVVVQWNFQIENNLSNTYELLALALLHMNNGNTPTHRIHSWHSSVKECFLTIGLVLAVTLHSLTRTASPFWFRECGSIFLRHCFPWDRERWADCLLRSFSLSERRKPLLSLTCNYSCHVQMANDAQYRSGVRLLVFEDRLKSMPQVTSL